MKHSIVITAVFLNILLITNPVYSACSPTGADCITLGNDLKLEFCLGYQGKTYETALDYFPNSDGFYWKMDVSRFKEIQTGNNTCVQVGNDLSFKFCCVGYQGVNYKFTLDYTPNPGDPSGLYWKMDNGSLAYSDQLSSLQQMLNNAIANSKTKTPGAVLLLATPSTQYVAASGQSNVVSNTAMKTNDMLRIASMTKTFLATVIMKLSEESKLNLDDTVAKHLPETASKIENAQTATIRQLLNMTSGIFEYYDNTDYLKAVDTRPSRQAWTPEEVIAYAFGQSAYFSPGAQFKYTNSNYILLEMIINKVSGATLASEMRRIIFTPLGMNNTFMEMAEAQTGGFGGLFVRGYDTGQNPIKDITEKNDALGLGDGGLVSDAQGLAKFLRALFKQKTILNDASLAQMKTIGFSEKEYGLGLEVKTSSVYGTNWGHSGKTAGFQGEMRYFPDKDTLFVILTNEENSNSDFIDVVFKGGMKLLYP